VSEKNQQENMKSSDISNFRLEWCCPLQNAKCLDSKGEVTLAVRTAIRTVCVINVRTASVTPP